MDVGALPECILCMVLAAMLYKHVLSIIFMPKVRSCVLTTTFRIGNRCTRPVERIPNMFAEIDAFTRLNTANIDVATVPERIPCMISATYACINKY